MLMKVTTSERFQPVEIGKVGESRAVIVAVPELMSAHAGIGMLGLIDRKYGLSKQLSRRVNDFRRQDRVKHKASDIILQLSSQTAAGFPDGNDCDLLRHDAAIKWALDRDPVTGQVGVSQESASKFQNAAIRNNNRRSVLNIFIDNYIRHHKKKHPKSVTIDFDGTMIKTYGHQQRATYRGGPYKHQMYFPLLGFIGNWLVAAVLRSGTQSKSRTILNELKVVAGKLKSKWPRIKIKVRLDAAFGSPALYRWYRENNVEYEIGLRPTFALNSNAQAFIQEAERKFKEEFGEPRFRGKDGKKKIQKEHERISNLPTDKHMAAEEELRKRRTRVVGEFSYKAEKWGFWERIIVRCDFTDKGLGIRYILVSQKFGNPQSIYEDTVPRPTVPTSSASFCMVWATSC